MTRLEELTLSLADELLTDDEASELEASLAENGRARQVHIRILEIEAGLRAERQNLELATSVMTRLRDGVADSIAQGVMAQIRAQPTPERAPDQSSTEGAANEASRVLPFPLTAPRRQRSLTHVWLPLAACLVLMAGAGVCFLGPTRGEPALAEVQGTGLSLQRASQPVPASAGTRLQSGDLLRTPETATATITFAPENTRITIQPGTELKLADRSRGKRFTLRVGKLEASVARQRPFRSMVIVTPQAEARVIGTKFTLAVDTNGTHLEVTEGKVRLTRVSDGLPVKVTAGHYAVAATNAELAALPATGRILREVWTNYPGQFLAVMTSDATVSEHPNDWQYLTRFETLSDAGHRFGERIRGYVHPPVTGEYRFSITAGDEAYLFLSPDDKPENRVQIIYDDNRPPLAVGPPGSGPSAPVPLVAGRKYYIEVLHESDHVNRNLLVKWQGPGREREIIPGEFLSPSKPKTKK